LTPSDYLTEYRRGINFGIPGIPKYTKMEACAVKKYYYCLDCKRIIGSDDKCSYCSGENFKELNSKTPVSVLGSKLKGNVLSTKDDTIRVLIRGEGKNNNTIKDYKAEQLKKVL
jgi:hypothetical protein